MKKRNLVIVGLMMCSSLWGSWDNAPDWVKEYRTGQTPKPKQPHKKQVHVPIKDNTIKSYTSPAWVEKYRVKGSDYKGAMWSAYRTNYSDNEVMMSKSLGMGISHGKYDFSKDKEIEVPTLSKIVIKQSEPCYITPFNFGKLKNIDGSIGINDITKAVKINKYTVEVYVGYSGGNPTTMLTNKQRVGFKKTVVADLTEKNAVQVLGKDFECLNEPNEETWTVYWYLKDEWVAMAREKFYLKP